MWGVLLAERLLIVERESAKSEFGDSATGGLEAEDGSREVKKQRERKE